MENNEQKKTDDIMFDIEDVKHVIEVKTSGKTVEHEGSIFYKLDSKIIELDITDCTELPAKFDFRKQIDAGCNPDKCINERRTCEGCKLENFASMVEFKVTLLRVKENENKRLIAIYHVC